jgi:hypothetical protein
MKKTIYTFAATLLVAGAILTSCDTAKQNEQDAKEEVKDAKQDLKEAQADVQREATAEEWQAFKADAEVRIANNEKEIAALRLKLKKPGKILDPLYEDRIAVLEQRNRDLRTRINSYESTRSGWEKFKSEYNHDMEALGTSLKDFGVDNKN